jgi:D-aminopeptidase
MVSKSFAIVLLMLLPGRAISAAADDAPANTRPRARDLQIEPGVFKPGARNAITDVAGVRVGHVTLVEGDDVRTGVTAIVPHDGNLFQEKAPAAVYVGNAFGKFAGSTQVNELGTLETPVVLTNTLAVGVAVDAVVQYTLGQPGNEQVRSVNAVVAETNDGGLNDIRTRHVDAADVLSAIAAARGGEVAEGCVGAGTGCEAFDFKGGIGTSSRKLPAEFGGWTLGVLVQANFGGVLSVDGVAVGKLLRHHAFLEPVDAPAVPDEPRRRSADGSCIVVAATDAPLTSNDLRRVAARAIFGLARTGSSYSNGSGDYAIAFSTARDVRVAHGDLSMRERRTLPAEALTPLFEAALEATEEAVYNALLRATTTTGRGRTVEALPVERLRRLLRSREAGAGLPSDGSDGRGAD